VDVTQIILLLCIVTPWLWGCQAALPRFKPPLDEEGEVHLYLQPLPPEADRLTATFEAIAAITADGREIPLTVGLQQLKGAEARRQRRMASGVLPAGDYAGFSFKVAAASLKGEGRDTALLVPGTPTRVEFKFTVSRRKAYVVWVVLRYRESVAAGFAFEPALAVFFPDKPPADLRGFVSNAASNDLTVFNKKTLQVVEVIATGRRPLGMALDQRLHRAYVALAGEDSVEVVDILAGNVSDRIRLRPGDEPQELALTPDGRTLLSVNKGSNSVSLIDPVSRFEVTRVRVGNGPRSILMEPTGRRAFVFNQLSNTMSVIDISTQTLIPGVATDPGPVRGQLNRRGDRLYVIHETSPYVLVFHPSTLALVGRFPVRGGMVAAKTDPITDRVYLARRRDVVVGLYDPLSFALVGFVGVGRSTTYMTIAGDENNLFMVSPETGSVLVSNLISQRIVTEIEVGEEPYWVSMQGER
jgi:YVTN family beta-propeller protein